MSVHLQIQHQLRSASRCFELSIQLQTSAQRIALFGPSGSGKTLTVQAIAGLLTPNAGRIAVNSTVFFDAIQAINKPPQQRKLAYLLQDYGLFPHLTVRQNIAFGLRGGFFNPSKRWLPKEAMYWVQAFELEAILNNYPDEISGGQKQRTALARALAVAPELLLLDEPLTALDMSLRVRMRQELAQLQQKLAIPSIIITHDPADAVMLADEVYCIAEGRIVGQCHPEDLL